MRPDLDICNDIETIRAEAKRLDRVIEVVIEEMVALRDELDRIKNEAQ